jgi:hypothetical protein
MYLIHEQLIFYRYIFLSPVLETLISASQKSQGYPYLFRIQLHEVVTGNFFFLSI